MNAAVSFAGALRGTRSSASSSVVALPVRGLCSPRFGGSACRRPSSRAPLSGPRVPRSSFPRLAALVARGLVGAARSLAGFSALRSARGLREKGVTDLHLGVPAWSPHGPVPVPESSDTATQHSVSRSEVGR